MRREWEEREREFKPTGGLLRRAADVRETNDPCVSAAETLEDFAAMTKQRSRLCIGSLSRPVHIVAHPWMRVDNGSRTYTVNT